MVKSSRTRGKILSEGIGKMNVFFSPNSPAFGIQITRPTFTTKNVCDDDPIKLRIYVAFQ